MAVFPVSTETPIEAVPYVAPEGQFVHYEGSPFELYQPYPPAGINPPPLLSW